MLPNPVPITFPIEFISIPETNYKVGRSQLPIAVVIHIAEGSKHSVIATFKDPTVQKSSHFLVNKDGSITQFVSTKNTAYCNGIVVNPISQLVLERPGVNPNGWTVSLENEGVSTSDITEAQYQTNAKIIKYLHGAWNIPLDSTHIFRHREITSEKSCPGAVNVEKIIQLARKL